MFMALMGLLRHVMMDIMVNIVVCLMVSPLDGLIDWVRLECSMQHILIMLLMVCLAATALSGLA